MDGHEGRGGRFLRRLMRLLCKIILIKKLLKKVTFAVIPGLHQGIENIWRVPI